MITLKFTKPSGIPVEAECITPDEFRNKSVAEISALPIVYGNRSEKLAEFFRIDGDASDGKIFVEGDCSTVKWIGANMTFGEITIEGNVGMHLGSEMSGGKIVLHGNATDWVGGEMRGGTITIHGNAGHLVGSGYRGSRHGMRGGAIIVNGNAGNEIGSVMRRGLIAIKGNTGDFAGVSMIAGTLVIGGTAGIRIGAGMKRGTIICANERPHLLPTFRHSCDYNPLFMRLFQSALQTLGYDGDWDIDKEFACYRGDMVSLGKGEIFCPC